MNKLLSILLVVLFITVPIFVVEAVTITNPLKYDSFEEIIVAVTDFIWKVIIIVAPLLIVVAGFIWMTAGGNTTRITQARDIILWTVVGSSVVLFAKGIISLINYVIGVK